MITIFINILNHPDPTLIFQGGELFFCTLFLKEGNNLLCFLVARSLAKNEDAYNTLYGMKMEIRKWTSIKKKQKKKKKRVKFFYISKKPLTLFKSSFRGFGKAETHHVLPR